MIVNHIDENRNRVRITRNSYLWNTVAGILMALQSVVMLMVLMRVCDLATAGVFTFAYASANLFLNVGKYGMRNYQVSDTDERFSFREYAASRIITCVVMFVMALAYLFISASLLDYSLEKIVVVVLMTFFKLIDAAEEVFHADYQRQGRLDVGAQALTFRLASTLLMFAGSVILLHSLAPALAIATIYTTLFFIVETLIIRRHLAMPGCTGYFALENVWKLLKTCFPLFLAAFLLFYIGNSPKYAIDVIMDDIAQAYYGFIAMPVFVVSLLATFVYNPMITTLAELWKAGRLREFVSKFVRLVLIVLAITVVCVGLAWFAGVPVLNLLYGTDVSTYIIDLLALVAGGGFLALTALFTLGITIIRYQRSLIAGYVMVAIMAFFGSSYAVANWGISGASWAYFILMAVLAMWFCLTFTIGIKRNAQKSMSR